MLRHRSWAMRAAALLGALGSWPTSVQAGFDPALRLSEHIADIAYRNGLIFRAFGDNIRVRPGPLLRAREFDLLFERREGPRRGAACSRVREAMSGGRRSR